VIRLLLDQGLPRSTVELLNADGWDVLHASQCGLSTATDENILEDVASLLKRVWSEIGVSIERGAVVTVTERAIRLRRLPVVDDSEKQAT
jgi:hypothetical protein